MTYKSDSKRFIVTWRDMLDRLLDRMAREQGDPMLAVTAVSEGLVEDAELVLDDFDGVSVSATEDGLEMVGLPGDDLPRRALRGSDMPRIRLEVAKVLMQALDAYLEEEPKARDAAVRSLEWHHAKG